MKSDNTSKLWLKLPKSWARPSLSDQTASNALVSLYSAIALHAMEGLIALNNHAEFVHRLKFACGDDDLSLGLKRKGKKMPYE